MPDIILKDKTGNESTYSNVNIIKVPKVGGGEQLFRSGSNNLVGTNDHDYTLRIDSKYINTTNEHEQDTYRIDSKYVNLSNQHDDTYFIFNDNYAYMTNPTDTYSISYRYVEENKNKKGN